jgi:hypothetical protein
MSMQLARGLTTTRTSRRTKAPSKAKVDMWRREWKAHCKTRRKYRLPVPTFEQFVEQVHGKVDLSHNLNEVRPDPVVQSSRKHRERYQSASDETYVAPERSVMDPRSLELEPKHVREEILAKSKRRAPAYSKGPEQYVTDGMDRRELGRKL